MNPFMTCVRVFACAATLTAFHASAANYTTWQMDNFNRGVNNTETVLTPALLGQEGKVGLLFTQAFEGQSYATPLYVQNVIVNGAGAPRNVVYVATMHNYVYCFDADNNLGANATYLWRKDLSPTGTTPIPASDIPSPDVTVEYGIISTPVIDAATNTLYVINKCKRTSNGTYEMYINALDIRTGAHKFNSPYLLNNITYPGTGNGNVGGVITFNGLKENNRPSLALHNGIVYAGFASHSDSYPFHGWMIGFDAANVSSVVKKFVAAPNNDEAGIWMGSSKPGFDSAGNMYFLTGNGEVSPASSNFGEAFLKLPTTGTFGVSSALNYFIPNNWLTLNNGDLDLGSGGPLILPDQAGPHPHLVVGGGKGGVLYVIDRDNLGGLNTPDNSVQQIAEGGGGNRRIFTTPSYFNGYIYYAPTGGSLLQRAVGYNAANGTYVGVTPFAASTWEYNGGKGAGAFITANGTQDGVVWAISAGTPSELHAYNAASVAGNPIYKFITKYGPTQINETANKYTLPVVMNGKAYLTAFSATGTASTGHLYVIGKLEGAAGTPTAPTNLAAFAATSSKITLNWTDNSSDESGFKIKRSTAAGGPFTTIFTASANVTTFTDSNLVPSTNYYYQITGTNSVGESVPTNTASAVTFPFFNEPGLIAYWSLDEGDGILIADLTGLGHTGDRSTGTETTWYSGVNDNNVYTGLAYLNFHGAGNAPSRFIVQDKPDLRFTAAQSFTISTWVRSLAVTGIERAIIQKSRDYGSYYGIWLNAANKWTFRGPTADVVGTATAVQGQWTHLAAVQDGPANTRKLYVNGVQSGPTGVAQAGTGTNALWVGQTQLASAESFGGDIDEVRIYNRALAASEITNLKAPPSLQTTSKLTQGAAGTFQRIIGPSASRQLESRRGVTQGTYDVMLNFTVPVSGIAVALQYQAGTTGTPVGAVGAITYSNGNRTATVRLTGVGNVQPLNLRLTGLQPGSGTLDVPFNILWGDVNSDNVVNAQDVTLVQNNQTATVTGANFQYDINCDGAVTAADTSLVQGYVGTNLGTQQSYLLSLGKTATGSSYEDPIGQPANAVTDTDTTLTRWSSAQLHDPEWIYIDLGQTCTVTAVSVVWENAGGKDYRFEVADNPAGPWTVVKTVTGNTAVNTDLYTPVTTVASGRYVRMYGTVRIAPAYGYSLFDFKVFGQVGGGGGGGQTAAVITSALTKSGTVGTALSYTITASGNPAPTTFTATPLPAGLTFAAGTGTISGTPTAAVTNFNTTITASNGVGSPDSKTLVFNISGSGQTSAVITSALTKSGTVGTALTYTITASGNPTPTTFTATPLPAGLTFTAGTGTISGTPTAAVTNFNTTITASNGVGAADSKTLVFNITGGGGGGSNLALGKNAVANTTEFGVATNVTDGNPNDPSRWASLNTDPDPWIYVDLGSPQTFDKVTLRWEAAYGVAYKIQTSNTANGTDWVDAASLTGQNGGQDDITFTAKTARYVRMLGVTKALPPYGFSIYEFEVYNTTSGQTPATITSALTKTGTVGTALTYTITASGNPAPTTFTATPLPAGLTFTAGTGTISGTPTAAVTNFNTTITASNGVGAADSKTLVFNISPAGTDTNVAVGKAADGSTFQAGNGYAGANDNNAGTRWAAADGAYPQFWRVDLASNYVLSRVDTTWLNSAGRAYKYKIETSPDNVTYTLRIDKTGNTTFGDTSDVFPAPVTARWVKITVTGATGGNASAWEFKVFGH